MDTVHTREGSKACGICHRKFDRSPGESWSQWERRKFCSWECAKQRPRARGEARVGVWKGGRTEHDGYIRVYAPDDHPLREMRGRHRYILEHRLVMAEHLGRPLRPDETVHHLNGDRSDNRIENLELRVGRHGKGATAPHCSTCTCFHEEH